MNDNQGDTTIHNSVLDKVIDHTKVQEARKRRQKRLGRLILGLVITVLFLTITTTYFAYEFYVTTLLEKAQAPIPQTADELVDALRKHIVLPDTTPQIAAIKDVDKLKVSQEFFRNAINGDVVVVYDAMIIVYRPTQDVIVSVGDLGSTSAR